MYKITILITLCLGTLFAQEKQEKLITFKMEDQFENMYSSDDYKGKMVIVITSDREGSDYNKVWGKTLNDSLTANKKKLGTIPILAVANLEAVPYLMRSIVQSFFPDNPKNKIIMDWEGKFAQAYNVAAAKSNILLFDKEHKLITHLKVTTFNQEKFNHLYQLVKAHSAIEKEKR